MLKTTARRRGGETCISFVSGEMTGEMKNLKKSVKKINISRTISERIAERMQRLKKMDGIGKVNGTL